ncbi:diguanylate cyclase [Candidatus Aerophobetes bacterium]|nr:diguanylate cyclase [Candidatus Aerophobetes bacterium]
MGDIVSELVGSNICRIIADASPLAFVVWTPDCKVVYWNKSAQRIFGWREEEIIGKNFFDFLIPQSARKEVEKVVKELKTGKLPIHSINDNLTKEGRIIRCEWYNTILKDDKGKLQLVISMAQDITEREKLQQRLKREHNLLRTLMDNIPDSVYFKDRRNRFVLVNKAKASHAGTIPEEMVGKTDFDFLQIDEAKSSFADDKMVMESKKPLVDKTEKITHADGKEYWISVTKVPWYNDKGEVIGTMGISRDITKRKEQQDEIERLGKLYRLIGRSINRANTIGELSYRILRGLREVVGFDFGGIFIYDSEKGILFLLTSVGFPRRLRFKKKFKECEEDIIIKAALSNKSFYVYNPQEKKVKFYLLSPFESYGINLKEVYATPLKTRDRLHGVLCICKVQGKTLSEGDRRLIENISEDIAAGITKIRAEETLRELVARDPLTGPFNYRCFCQMLEEEKERSRRYREVYSFLYIDIDNFKECNDTYGHQEGDKVLQIISGILKNHLRKIDSAYRLGGEEFGVLLPHTSKKEAEKVAKRIQKEIHQKLYPQYKITVSMGVADSRDGSDVVKKADAAMYEAKRKGKDRICVA